MATIAQYRLRVDAAADWVSSDPTLLLGELGLENDTLKMKMGDGSTAWTSLGYIYHTPSEMTTISGDLVAVHHTRSHAITGTSDHTAGNWKVVYTDGSGDVKELALGSTAGTVLSTNGASAAPTFIDHGDMSGLGDDDHQQYINDTEMTTISGDLVAQLHTRSHAITGTSDHTAGNWKVVYTDGSGDVKELALGSTAGTVLSTNGASSAPTFIDHGDMSGLGDDDHQQYINDTEMTTISGDLVAQLHTQSHAITSTSDHTAGNWKVTHTNGSGEVIEVALGASGTVLTSQGAGIAPIFV